MTHRQLPNSFLVLGTIDELIQVIVVLGQPFLLLGVVWIVDRLICPWTDDVEFGVEYVDALQP